MREAKKKGDSKKEREGKEILEGEEGGMLTFTNNLACNIGEDLGESGFHLCLERGGIHGCPLGVYH
jgi:hypothetical protein